MSEQRNDRDGSIHARTQTCSKEFLGRISQHAIYHFNQSPTLAIKDKSPEEVWSGRKPRISHLKSFGSLAFVWIPDASHTKLDVRNQKLMLVGYSSLHKTYRLVDVETSHLIYISHVVFDEQGGLIMLVSPVPNPVDQPMKAHDLGVRLPLGPPNGRAPVALATPVIPLIHVQTHPTSPVGSPQFVDASPNFDLDSSDEELDHQASPLLSGLSGGLRHLLIFVMISSLMGEMLEKEQTYRV